MFQAEQELLLGYDGMQVIQGIGMQVILCLPGFEPSRVILVWVNCYMT